MDNTGLSWSKNQNRELISPKFMVSIDCRDECSFVAWVRSQPNFATGITDADSSVCCDHFPLLPFVLLV